MANAAHIGVRGRNAAGIVGATQDCVIGRDLHIDLQALQDYCAAFFSNIEHDLVVVCGAVLFADRVVRRRRATGWSRYLEVTLPVNQPDKWREPRINNALIEALEFVTGDFWKFNFVGGRTRVAIDQSSMSFEDGPYVVMPFSDGMDSFLQWKLLSAERSNQKVLRVQTSNRSMNEARNKSIDRTGAQQDQRLRMPVSAAVGNHAEPTYRTRTFLYFCMAGLAAAKANSGRVVIGENGIGGLGPSMISYGNECPHRTTHPAYTRRIAGFLNALLDTTVVFEHPQVLRTKGEVLAHAVALGVKGWETTNSCVRGPRDKLGQLPCGACSGCLLRRSAILAAGIEPSGFFWERLDSVSLDAARQSNSGRDATDNDWDIVRHGAHAMNELAQLARLEAQAPVFQRVAWDLAEGARARLTDTSKAVHRLVETHRTEWNALLTHFDGASILNIKQAS